MKQVSEALRRTGKPPITVRWVEVNKGDDQCPKIRSRLVAREIRLKGEEAIFAPTPPLESLRMVLSHATTQLPDENKKVWDADSPDRQMIFFMDLFSGRTSMPRWMKTTQSTSSYPRRSMQRLVCALCSSGICMGLAEPRMAGSPSTAGH